MSAMRNLNRQELNSRVLRVDYAANEKTKEEIRNLQTSMNGVFESPYGPEIDPETAPEEITKVVASLPPEQMFELAKQMKQCIQTNPTEAKNMLIQNPQLCYGLLQALVVMRVVDSNVALKMLHRSNPSVKPLKLSDNVQQQPARQQTTIPPQIPPIIPNLNLPPSQLTGPPQLPPNNWPPQTDQFGRAIPPVLPNITQQTSVINTATQPPPSSFDPRMYNRMQNLPANNNLDPRIRQQNAQQQQNSLNQQTSSNLDPRQFTQQQNTSANLDPRARSQNSIQNNNNNNNSNNRNPQAVNTNQQVPMFNQNQVRPNLNQAPGLISADEQDEQQQQHRHLMMQVMSLSDEQIAVLPLPQRQGILQLKQQIQASNMQL